MTAKFIRLAISALVISLISTTFSSAAPLSGQLTFNELKIGEEALNFYNGGFGSLGTGPGPDFGVSFTSDFITVPVGVALPNPLIQQSEQLTGSSGTMNVLGGFSGAFSFYYIASQSSSAELFSGLNGTGTMMGVISLPVMPTTPWFPAGGAFGPFESVVFNGAGLEVDNISFGGGLVVPEPLTAALLPAGLILCFTLGKCKLRRRVKGAQL